MTDIKIACQTYTWEMLGSEWTGSMDDIVKMVSEAGYAGIETTNTMIGTYYHTPKDFTSLLRKNELNFCAFGCVGKFGFTDASKIDMEIEEIKKGIDFLSHFPGCRLVLAGGSSESRDNLEEKFRTMCTIYNRAAKLAAEKNIPVDVHAHSHAGSIIESEEEYGKMLKMTAGNGIGWNPDTGHIIRGGSDLIRLLEKHVSRITHVHFKDVDARGTWKRFGEGITDYKSVFNLLENTGYTGWVVSEEESAEAFENQFDSIAFNRTYLHRLGY